MALQTPSICCYSQSSLLITTQHALRVLWAVARLFCSDEFSNITIMFVFSLFVLLNLPQTPSLLTVLSRACESSFRLLRCCSLLLPDVTPPPPLPVTLGSGCQMRTLDSGIGTFPLPDSVTRAGGRHIPKSESSPDRVTAGSSELSRETSSSHPEPSRPDVKVPSLPKTRLHAPTSMGHSLSDPSVTCSSNNAQDTQSRLPKLATTGEKLSNFLILLVGLE